MKYLLIFIYSVLVIMLFFAVKAVKQVKADMPVELPRAYDDCFKKHCIDEEPQIIQEQPEKETVIKPAKPTQRSLK